MAHLNFITKKIIARIQKKLKISGEQNIPTNISTSLVVFVSRNTSLFDFLITLAVAQKYNLSQPVWINNPLFFLTLSLTRFFEIFATSKKETSFTKKLLPNLNTLFSTENSLIYSLPDKKQRRDTLDDILFISKKLHWDIVFIGVDVHITKTQKNNEDTIIDRLPPENSWINKLRKYIKILVYRKNISVTLTPALPLTDWLSHSLYEDKKKQSIELKHSLHNLFNHLSLNNNGGSIHYNISNSGYTTQERADQGTTKSRNEAYEFVRRSDPASFLRNYAGQALVRASTLNKTCPSKLRRSVVGRSDETRSNEGMRSYGAVYIHRGKKLLLEALINDEQFQRIITQEKRLSNNSLDTIAKQLIRTIHGLAADYNAWIIKMYYSSIGFILKRRYQEISYDPSVFERIKQRNHSQILILTVKDKKFSDISIIAYLCYKHELTLPMIAVKNMWNVFPLRPLLNKLSMYFVKEKISPKDYTYQGLIQLYLSYIISEKYVQLISARKSLITLLYHYYEIHPGSDLVFLPLEIEHEVRNEKEKRIKISYNKPISLSEFDRNNTFSSREEKIDNFLLFFS